MQSHEPFTQENMGSIPYSPVFIVWKRISLRYLAFATLKTCQHPRPCGTLYVCKCYIAVMQMKSEEVSSGLESLWKVSANREHEMQGGTLLGNGFYPDLSLMLINNFF